MPDTNWEDFYEILGVDSGAEPEQISRAYRSLVMDYHPDRQVGATDAVRRLAEDKLKDINRAHNILGDQESRRRYHEDWHRRKSPPQPAVEPKFLEFTDVPVGESSSASFIISNIGGPYNGKPVVDLPAALWIEATDYVQLDADKELPAKVEVRVIAEKANASFTDTISVRLDTQEVQIKVNLQTRPEQAHESVSRVSPSTTARPPVSQSSSPSPQSPERSVNFVRIALAPFVGLLYGILFMITYGIMAAIPIVIILAILDAVGGPRAVEIGGDVSWTIWVLVGIVGFIWGAHGHIANE